MNMELEDILNEFQNEDRDMAQKPEWIEQFRNGQ